MNAGALPLGRVGAGLGERSVRPGLWRGTVCAWRGAQAVPIHLLEVLLRQTELSSHSLSILSSDSVRRNRGSEVQQPGEERIPTSLSQFH